MSDTRWENRLPAGFFKVNEFDKEVRLALLASAPETWRSPLRLLTVWNALSFQRTTLMYDNKTLPLPFLPFITTKSVCFLPIVVQSDDH